MYLNKWSLTKPRVSKENDIAFDDEAFEIRGESVVTTVSRRNDILSDRVCEIQIRKGMEDELQIKKGKRVILLVPTIRGNSHG
ncbi:hypothetical protein G6Y30_06980 [Staphylococcus aureus]|nr:hypothetical protein [Staphylococcus aureus]